MAIQATTPSLIIGLLVYTLPVLGGVITANCSNVLYQAAADPSAQYGYNLCNATTETQSSLCQTGFINALDDFCLWGPAEPTDLGPLSDTQLERTVAFCTRPGHGTRVIPVQVFWWVSYVKTPSYIEVYGQFNIDMSSINYLYNGLDDLIAEMDPRGVDGRGEPIGGLMYSNAFSASHGQYIQAVEWFSLIGSNFFYLRACDPNISGSEAYCQRWNNTYYSWIDAAFPGWYTDALALPDTYQECLGDSRPLGLVIDESGSTVTYTGQSLSLPTPIIYPSATTSSCKTYANYQLFQSMPSIAPGGEVCPTPSITSSTTSSTTSIPLSNPTSTKIPSNSTKQSSSTRAGAIIATVGWLLLLFCFWVGFFSFRKRKASNKGNFDSPRIDTDQLSPQFQDAPFSIPPISSRTVSCTGLKTLARIPEEHTDASSYASRRGPTASRSLPPSYLPGGSYARVETHNELGLWANENRGVISADLEQRLRDAHYLPSDNPDDISAQEWREQHRVGDFELKRLQELYRTRSSATATMAKGIHGSGQGRLPCNPPE